MSDQKLRDFLKQGAPSVPESGPQEYQLIMRRIRNEQTGSLQRRWQLWTAIGFIALVLSLFMTFTRQDERNVEEDLYRDLDAAEWVHVNQSDGYKDWLQLAEYSTVEPEL